MKLVDAYAMHKKSPDSFDLPTETGDIMVGDFVKLATANERAWVKVTRRRGSRFTGKPMDPRTFGGARSVSFTTRNIYDWTEAGSKSISTWVKTGDDSMPVSSAEPVSLMPAAIVIAAVIGYKLLSR